MVNDVAPAKPENIYEADISTISKPGKLPAHAWTIVAESKENLFSEDEINEDKKEKTAHGPSKSFHERFKIFYISLLIYGVDISGVPNKTKAVMMCILRYLVIFANIAILIIHWLELVCSLKDGYTLYGSTLINLVFTARLTSGMVSHAVFYNRIKPMTVLMKKLDEVSNTVSCSRPMKRNIIICLLVGVISIAMYCVFPVKYYIDPKYADVANLTSSVTNAQCYIIHRYTIIILDNILMNLFTSYLLYYDVAAMAFFVTFAARFLAVFRDSSFCRWFSNGDKHEIGTVMKKFRKHHFIICGVVEEIDAVFAPTVLIWYVYLTLSLCCWIRGFSTTAFQSYDGTITVFFCLIFAFTEFYLLSVSTSFINDEVTNHLDSIRLMCINEDCDFTSSMTAMQDRISHLSYVTCVLAAPVSLTGWGFFSVSKGFVLTVSSTVLTFTLVLYGV